MDDLKLYARDANDLEDLLKTVECSGDEKETNCGLEKMEKATFKKVKIKSTPRF